jgi:hypothetical protein
VPDRFDVTARLMELAPPKGDHLAGERVSDGLDVADERSLHHVS